MAEAEAAASPEATASPTEATPAPGKRLLESTLYKEDVWINDHTSVWGSLYDLELKRWGYKCCKIMEKNGACTAEKAPEPEPNSSDLDNSPDSEDLLGPGGLEIIDWSDPPLELKPRESFKEATAWVEHFVRYHVGAWQRKADANYAGFPDLAVTTLKPLLKPSQEALEILIRRLHNPRELVLEQLDDISSNCSKLDYLAARAGYMKLTLGNKTWNNTFVAHVAACTMKGAREYRRNRDNFNTYDMDPDSQKYMHALLKLVQLAQCLRPNEDQSKNCVF